MSFDLIVASVLLVSAAVGFFRGATREVVSVLAFIVAVVLAIVCLRFTSPIFLKFISAEWIAKAAALIVVFLAVYILLRLAGGFLTKTIHAAKLGPIDRAIGLGFGLVRALVMLGVFNLVFHAATPPERTATSKGMPVVAPNFVPMIFSMLATPASICACNSFGYVRLWA